MIIDPHVQLTKSTADRIAAAARRAEQAYVPATRGGSPWTPPRATANVRLLKLSSAATARGEYVGRMSVGTLTAPDGTTDLVISNVWIDPGADNCIVLNPAEVTGIAGGHVLPTGGDQLYSAIISGASDEDTPRQVAILIGAYNATIRAKIVSSTLVSGSSMRWTYTMQPVEWDGTAWQDTDDDTFDATNDFEDGNVWADGGITSYLGVTISAADGTVNGGTCKLVPLGPGLVVNCQVKPDGSGGVVYAFREANSAQGDA